MVPLPGNASNIAFIVPVKPFKQAKSRLVEIFPENARSLMQERLGIALFDDTMAVLSAFLSRHTKGHMKAIISSSDDDVGQRTRLLGDNFIFLKETAMETRGQDKKANLDMIINDANIYAMSVFKARGTILLMGDLPLLTVHALVGLFKRITRYRTSPNVILSPSMGNGCNMIARFPPDIIPTRYSTKHGPSFIEHLTIARQKEIPVEIYQNLDMYLDLDTSDDLINLHPLLKEIRPDSRLLSVLNDVNVCIEKNDITDTRRVSIKVDMNDIRK